jgi:voltage-gated potassium channel
MWIQTEERRIEHEILRDLHREIRVLRDEFAAMRGEAHSRSETP